MTLPAGSGFWAMGRLSLALDAGASLAEAAVIARHANAKVTGAIYAGVSESGKAKIASKLVDAGIGA